MGGRSIFRVKENDANLGGVIIETLTNYGSHQAMAQKFIPPEITEGDKRILLIEASRYPMPLHAFRHTVRIAATWPPEVVVRAGS